MPRILILFGLLFIISCQLHESGLDITPNCRISYDDIQFSIDGVPFCFKYTDPVFSNTRVSDSTLAHLTTFTSNRNFVRISFLTRTAIEAWTDDVYRQKLYDLRQTLLPGAFKILGESEHRNVGSFAVEFFVEEQGYSSLIGDQSEGYVKVLASEVVYVDEEHESYLEFKVEIKCVLNSDVDSPKTFLGVTNLKVTLL